MSSLAFTKTEVKLERLRKHLSDGTELGLSSTCREDFLIYLQHLRYGSDWALKMLTIVVVGATAFDYAGRSKEKAHVPYTVIDSSHRSDKDGNPEDLTKSNFVTAIIDRASLAVDTFLFIGNIPGVYSYLHDVYVKPYFRIETYLMGILLGHYIIANEEAITLKRWHKYLGWLLCLLCLLFAMLGLPIMNPHSPAPWSGVFIAATPTIWNLGIAWIIYTYVAGCGGKGILQSALKPCGNLHVS
ncbi:hypothetical protein MTO96_041975 [Rhipicephalus appendiculatus]